VAFVFFVAITGEVKATEVTDLEVKAIRYDGYYAGFRRHPRGYYEYPRPSPRCGRSATDDIQIAEMEGKELHLAVYHGYGGVRGGHRGYDHHDYGLPIIDDFMPQENY